MPNFKEFINGFEEKPEAENPKPAPTPKPQEVKMVEPQQKPKSPWEMETTGNPEEDKRLERVIEERVRQGYDSKGLHNPYTIKDMDYLGFGSLEALENATFGQQPQQAEALIKDFKEGKIDRKGLAQFGKNPYASEILSYLLSKIK